MKKANLSLILRAAVSIVLILILLYIMRDRYGQIIEALKSADLAVAGLGFIVFVCAVSVASLRLKLIIDANDMKTTFKEAVSLTFLGYFFNNFLPTAIGGDVVKGFYLARKTSEKTASYTAVFVDRAIGLFTMIFMAFIALLFVNGNIIDRKVKIMIYAFTLISVLIIAFMTNKKIAAKFSFLLFLVKPIEEKLINIYNAVHQYKHHGILMLQSFSISILSQLLFFISIGILAISINARIPAMQLFLKMPIVSMMSLLPSINGLGIREGSTVLLFGPTIGKGNAFAVSILWLVILFITSLIGGIIYGLSPQFKMNFKEIKTGEDK